MRVTALVLALAASFVLTTPAFAQPQDPVDLRAWLRDRTVLIKVQFVDPSNENNVCSVANYGSGTVVTEAGYILSVNHILDPPKDKDGKNLCQGFTDHRITARIGYLSSDTVWKLMHLESDRKRDLGIYWFGNPPRQFDHVKLCHAQPRNGEALLGAGFPRGEDWIALDAQFQNDDGGRWVVSVAFTYGQSGGPVVDRTGRLVAVIKGGLGSEAAIRFVVPIKLAASLLDYAGIAGVQSCLDRSTDAIVSTIVTVRFALRVRPESS